MYSYAAENTKNKTVVAFLSDHYVRVVSKKRIERLQLRAAKIIISLEAQSIKERNLKFINDEIFLIKQLRDMTLKAALKLREDRSMKKHDVALEAKERLAKQLQELS